MHFLLQRNREKTLATTMLIWTISYPLLNIQVSLSSMFSLGKGISLSRSNLKCYLKKDFSLSTNF